jgi:putative flavoprotein involved in K+ transport
MERNRVVVVGAGQAGLATSYWLADREIDHVLLDRARSGDSWRHRWDSFCLVTPNWTLRLPGFPYNGENPDGFILRDQIADYVERYREFLDAPVVESTEVTRLTSVDEGWHLATGNGDWMANAVVVATGGFPFPSTPKVAADIDPDVAQVHSHDYRTPSALPEGAVLVVGAGQSGGQIVDDLLLEGREVWFAVGHSARAPRRYRGKDMTRWMFDLGFGDTPIQDPAMRARPSMMVSGRDGGKDLDARAFGRDGVHLVGRVTEASGSKLHFSDDVEEQISGADAVAAEVTAMVDRYITEKDIDAPADTTDPISWSPGKTPTEVDLASAGISSIVWATGYHYDFSWIDADVFGERGYPDQIRGVTEQPGLYFMGLHGMHTVGSGLFWGVGADAEHVVGHLVNCLA